MRVSAIGDVNGDCKLDVADALAILRFIVGLSSVLDNCNAALRAAIIANPGASAPDVNDVLQILRFIVRLSSELDDAWCRETGRYLL
jgi:hypothetical protein